MILEHRVEDLDAMFVRRLLVHLEQPCGALAGNRVQSSISGDLYEGTDLVLPGDGDTLIQLFLLLGKVSDDMTDNRSRLEFEFDVTCH
jgi:hypothetical protein